jgi:hypothetical protein
LSYSKTTGFYTAPIQAVANGGVLVIDDFGRQRCSARDLLNRWIVPLESRVDFLTLKTGQKFELPFMVLVVFATNIRPSELVDEAFLRRIHYKVLAESPTIADFKRIFANVPGTRDLVDEQIVDGLLARRTPKRIAPRGCHPRDLIDQALAQADYLGQPRELTPNLLEAACASYFVDDTKLRRSPFDRVVGDSAAALVATTAACRGVARRPRGTGTAHYVAARPHRFARHDPHRGAPGEPRPAQARRRAVLRRRAVAGERYRRPALRRPLDR